MNPSFEIYSSDGNHAADYSVTLKNSISVNANQGQGSTTTFTPSDVTATITVTNPCLLTTISTITFDTTPLLVTKGSTGTSTFTPPSDGVDTDNKLTGLCGTKTYTVVNNADNTALTGSWAIVRDSATTGKKELFVNPSLFPEAIGVDKVFVLKITTKFASWSTNTGSVSTISVTLKPTSCSCAAMAWTQPTIQSVTVNIAATAKVLGTTQSGSDPYFPPPVSSDAAKATNTQFNACWELGTPCTTTGSYATANIKYDPGTG